MTTCPPPPELVRLDVAPGDRGTLDVLGGRRPGEVENLLRETIWLSVPATAPDDEPPASRHEAGRREAVHEDWEALRATIGPGGRVRVVLPRGPRALLFGAPIREVDLLPTRIRLVVERPASALVIQRRSFVRVPVSFGIPVIAEHDGFDGRVVDLSAGGLRFASARPVEPGAVLRVRLPLEDGPLDVVALVVRARRTLAGPVEAACRLVDLPERDEDRVVRYVLATERRRAALRWTAPA